VVELSIRNRAVVGSNPTGGSSVRSPLCFGALAAACWWWVPTARAQNPAEPVPHCSQRWIYQPPPTTYYLAPPVVSDSTGTLFWREVSESPELVAVRDGVARWRRPLPRGSESFLLSAMLLWEDLLVDAFGSTLEARRTSDGRIAWSRDLRLARNTAVETSTAARVGRAIVTASAASATAAWLTATAPDGKTLWRTRIRGPVARMAANGDRLYLLMSTTSVGERPVIAVDSSGKPIPDAAVPLEMGVAVRGEEVVFDRDHVVTAIIAPMPMHCPPNSPSCHPPPLTLTVTGFTAGQERWHFTRPPRGFQAQLLLLGDGSVLLVDNEGVEKIAPDGTRNRVCELPVVGHWSVAGLVHGDLVVTYHDSVAAYSLPGAPQLASDGWVMSGGGPGQGWAARVAASVPRFVPFPAGVADPDADVAYVQAEGGVTAALALADGTVKWRTQSPARPVGIWNGRVVVVEQGDTLTGALQVAQLDRESGAEVGTSERIPLGAFPDWARPTLAPWGSPLITEVRIEGDRARVVWDIPINGWPGGATIRPYTISGAAEVDLTTGAVSLSPSGPVEGAKPISRGLYPLGVEVGGRRFTLSYAATAILTVTNARSGKKLWSRRLWSIAVLPREIPPP
jgi:outer membrane protein assembly factor BamB